MVVAAAVDVLSVSDVVGSVDAKVERVVSVVKDVFSVSDVVVSVDVDEAPGQESI